MQKLITPYVIDGDKHTAIMREALGLWSCIVYTVSKHTGVPVRLIIERPRNETHPPKNVHHGRVLAAHVLFSLMEADTAQSWLRLCAGFSYAQQRGFLNAAPDRGVVYALAKLARTEHTLSGGRGKLAQLRLDGLFK